MPAKKKSGTAADSGRGAFQRRHRLPSRLRPIELPSPVLDGRRSLARSLQLRSTTREIARRALSRQMLSNLLWAADGINREDGPFAMPGRTAASASNSQEIDIYVCLPQAAYFYNPFAHSLLPAATGDLRGLAINRGQAQLSAEAPVRLVYVVDIDRLTNTRGFMEPGLRDPEVQRSYYYVDTGMIAANVYLFAASAGLASWFHNCQRRALASRLHLPQDQRVLFAQTVGYAAGQ